MIGRSVGRYRIIAKLGEGGMGSVWKAEDPLLGRSVALKFLSESLAASADARHRFLREARAAAAVTHPNIAAVYEVGEIDGAVFIAMELVEGRTLRATIGGRPLGIEEALRIGTEVAEALAKAHHARLIHRDLKPDNILVGMDGHPKIVDFGLAKHLLRSDSVQAPSSTRTETIPVELTRAGTLLGTPAYMAPEQARGEPIDERADIFSYGVTMYEMVTGTQPFKGRTSTDILSAILRDTPVPAGQINPEVPADLARIIGDCLEKDPNERYQHADQLAVDLRKLKRGIDSEAQAMRDTGERSLWLPFWVAAASRLGRRLWVAGTLAFAAAALLAIAFSLNLGGLRARLTAGGRVGQMASPLNVRVTQLTREPGIETDPTLSPDGKQVAYSAMAGDRSHIYLLRVGGARPIDLTPDSPDNDRQPAFSVDGARIAFRSDRDGGGIFVMGATGESVTRLTDFGYNPSWSPDGTKIAFVTQEAGDPAVKDQVGQLWVIDVASGDRTRIFAGDATQPSWSPSGRRIAYWANNGGQRDIWTIGASGENPVRVTHDAAIDWSPAWSPDGRYIYYSSDRGGSMNLWRLPIREESGEVLGLAEPITVPAPYAGTISLSRNGGRVAYVAVTTTRNIHAMGFEPIKGVIEGPPVAVTRGNWLLSFPAVSPDGSWIAFQTWGKQEDLLVIRTDGTGLRQLTDDAYKDRCPKWSPDGKRIAFHSNRTGRWNIWTMSPSGGELHQVTYAASGRGFADPLWSPDGARMFIVGGESDLMNAYTFDTARAWKDQTPRALARLGTAGGFLIADSWSADGMQLAGPWVSSDTTSLVVTTYSFASGRYTQYPELGGGDRTHWLKDGRHILYIARGHMLVLDVKTRRARDIFSSPSADIDNFDISPDERRIYFTNTNQESDLWLATLE